jgi:hypothetical protein
MELHIEDILHTYYGNLIKRFQESHMYRLIKGKKVKDLSHIEEFTLQYDGYYCKLIYKNNVSLIHIESACSRDIIDCIATLFGIYFGKQYFYVELCTIYGCLTDSEAELFQKTKMWRDLRGLDVIIFKETRNGKIYCIGDSEFRIKVGIMDIKVYYKIYKYEGELRSEGNYINRIFLKLIRGYITGNISSGAIFNASYKYYKSLTTLVCVNSTRENKFMDYVYWLRQDKKPRYLLTYSSDIKECMPNIIFLQMRSPRHTFTREMLPNLILFTSEIYKDGILGVENDPDAESHFYNLTFNTTKRAIQ